MNWGEGGTSTMGVCSVCGGGPNWHYVGCSVALTNAGTDGSLLRIAAALERIADLLAKRL